MVKKEKKAAKNSKEAILKVKKRKLKERGNRRRPAEVSKDSETVHPLETGKEEKPVQRNKEKKKDKGLKRRRKEKRISADACDGDLLYSKHIREDCEKTPEFIRDKHHAQESMQLKLRSDSTKLQEEIIETETKNKKKKRSSMRKHMDVNTIGKRNVEKSQIEVGTDLGDQVSSLDQDHPRGLEKKSKRNKKRKNKDLIADKERKLEESPHEVEPGIVDEILPLDKGNSKKVGKRRNRCVDGGRKKEIQNGVAEEVDQISSADNDGSRGMKKKSKRNKKWKNKDLIADNERKLEESPHEVEPGIVDEILPLDKGNSKKVGKRRNLGERKKEIQNRVAEEVDQISLVDNDCSRGMKKWLIEYKESRPGLKVLQQRIDEYITAYEAQLEQEREERETRIAEGGWTVVVHHKGRKKSTDSESGIAVGSVAQAAVVDKMSKKKNTEALPDFYRFQKREAKRNEIMMLQSKFEQDKKRIQQLRAARKFRPY